ncbi:MAG TPA: class III extradiol ring-cleavage dioxygenase [Dongiaceae bacterium]|nr:class III extradiol ring-cleavage dioxygenase [Dongiaceae bacterium]
MPDRMPVLFVSHGAPTLPFDDVPARRFLIELARKVPRPQAILCVSAHWEVPVPSLTAAPRPATIHDFSGFPKALYELTYDAPGAPDVAEHTAEVLRAAGYDPQLDAERGRDHGAWVPAMLAWPAGEIPMIQLSLLRGQSTHAHIKLGEAIAPLREEGVLILGSGGSVHNLRQVSWDGGRTPRWASDFQDWLDKTLAANDLAALAGYRGTLDVAQMAHPTEDHLMPLYVALGAGHGDGGAAKLHGSFTLGSLGMASYGWGM